MERPAAINPRGLYLGSLHTTAEIRSAVLDRILPAVVRVVRHAPGNVGRGGKRGAIFHGDGRAAAVSGCRVNSVKYRCLRLS